MLTDASHPAPPPPSLASFDRDGAQTRSSAAFTVAVIAYGVQYDIPVTGRTRILSVLREVAELAISSDNAAALGDVDAALFHEQLPLAPETAMRSLPKGCVLHFHTSLDTLVGRGKAGSFLRVTDLMKGSRATLSLRSLQPGSSLGFPSRGAAVASVDAGETDDEVRLRMLHRHMQHQSLHPLMSYPATPTGADAPLLSATPSLASLPPRAPTEGCHLCEQRLVPPRGRFTAALPGNPWGLEERGPTYRVPIQASQDYLLPVDDGPAKGRAEGSAADAAESFSQASRTSKAATPSKAKKGREALSAIPVNSAPAATPLSLSGVRRKLSALTFSSKHGSRRKQPAQDTTAPPVPSATEPRRRGRERTRTTRSPASAPAKRSASPSSLERSSYYKPAEDHQTEAPGRTEVTPEVKEQPEEAAATTAAEGEGKETEAEALLIDAVSGSAEDAQHRILFFDHRGLGPCVSLPPSPSDGNPGEHLQRLRVLRIAPVSAIRDFFAIDASKRLFIGSTVIDDETATVEATVVFLGSEAPAVFSFAEPNRSLRRRTADGAETDAEEMLRTSQELYRERQLQCASRASSPMNSPRGTPAPEAGAARGDLSPPPLPLPSAESPRLSPPVPSPKKEAAAAAVAVTAAPVTAEVRQHPGEEGGGGGGGGSKTGEAAKQASPERQQSESGRSRSSSHTRRSRSRSSSPSANTKEKRRPKKPSPPPLSAEEFRLAIPSNGSAGPDAPDSVSSATRRGSHSRSPFRVIRKLTAKRSSSARRSSTGSSLSPLSFTATATPTASGRDSEALTEPSVVVDAAADASTSSPTAGCPSQPPSPLGQTRVGEGCGAADGDADLSDTEKVFSRPPQMSKRRPKSTERRRGDGSTAAAVDNGHSGGGGDEDASVSPRPEPILQRTSTLRKAESAQPLPRLGSRSNSTNGFQTRSRSVSIDSPGNSLIHLHHEHHRAPAHEVVEAEPKAAAPPKLAISDPARNGNEKGSVDGHGGRGGDSAGGEVSLPSQSDAEDVRITVRDPRDCERFHFNIPVEGGCAAFAIRGWMTECLKEIAEEAAGEEGRGAAAAAAADYNKVELYDLYCDNVRITDPKATFREVTEGKNDRVFSLRRREGPEGPPQ